MRDAIALTDSIAGSSGFREHFEFLGPFDSAGRSLRQLDLESRLFSFPLSYLIYSAPFQALPLQAKESVYARLREILASTPAADERAGLSVGDRQAVSAILRETLPEAFSD
jgi:hypothetical protein